MSKGPLHGIKVVEISLFQQGPVAGMRLADLGADVIKVESMTGDPARGMMKMIGAMTGLKGGNYYFEHCNRNKRSIVLNLKKKEGKDAFLKLIEGADVFINNMSIDAPARIGLGPDALLERNPRLIYAHASGWGRKGADAKKLSFDYTGIARSGLMFACGEKDTPPSQVIAGIGDELGGLMCAWGVTVALYAREKTGKGQVVDTSLMGSIISLMGIIVAAPSTLGQEFPRDKRTLAGNPMYNHYRCKDDRWIALAHLDADRYWPALCKAVEAEEFVDDPRFSSLKARSVNAPELVAILDERFARKTFAEWEAVLDANGCIYTAVQTPRDVVNDHQALANDYVIPLEHPDFGSVKQVGFPWMFSDTPARYYHRAPKLGEHTEEILREIGYDESRIAGIKAEYGD